VIGSSLLPGGPLVGAGGVFASVVAGLCVEEGVFVLFRADVLVAKGLLWHVRNGVFVVSSTPEVSHDGAGECREVRVTNTRGSVVVALDIRVNLCEIHCSQRGQSSSKAMASRFDTSSRVLL